MKNLTLITVITINYLLLTINLFSQPCLPEGITFSTQEEIDNFQINYPNCTEIEGDVEICGNDITNLNGLSVITSIDSSLIIGLDTDILVNPNLTSLTGLENLTSVGGNLEIYNNEVLESLAGIENLTSIEGSLIIGLITYVGMPFPGSFYHGNPSLTSLTALDNLTFIGNELFILANPSLTSLDGLNNVTSVGGELRIIGNASMTSLTGLEGLTSFEGDIILGENEVLASLTGLENLASIDGSLNIGYLWKFASGGNPLLSSLSVLDNLTFIGGGLTIASNNSLTSLTGLDNVTSIEGGVRIFSNDALTSLTGLENLTSNVGHLDICDNDGLTSLIGLENITSIEGNLLIDGNENLTNLSDLNNLTSIGVDLWIEDNSALHSLTGLDNLEASSITDLHILRNPELSICDVESICDYLAAPNGAIHIHDNAPGCNSPEEVDSLCNPASVQELKNENKFTISPNPLESTSLINYPLKNNSPVNLKILDLSGREIVTLVNEVQQQGEQKIEFNSTGLPAGVYFFVLKTNNGIQTEKIIKL